MEKKTLLNTKEAAQFLNINEKMIYTLIAEKGLPATKVTGKWLFPKQLIEQWLENQTINYPKTLPPLPPYLGEYRKHGRAEGAGTRSLPCGIQPSFTG
jgi:excisionase family DNA binding protein